MRVTSLTGRSQLGYAHFGGGLWEVVVSSEGQKLDYSETKEAFGFGGLFAMKESVDFWVCRKLVC